MKSLRHLLVLTLLLGATTLPAQPATTQGSLSIDFTLRDNQGKPMPATTVDFIETLTRQKKSATTNADGKLSIKLDQGRYWQFNILDIINYYYWQVEVVPGKQLTMTRTTTYDYAKYERESRPAIDRAALALSTEAQKHQPDAALPAGHGAVKLEIVKANDQPLTNFPVAITCYALRKTYTTTTNPAGIATFVVPLGQEYEVDIDGIPSFNYCDLPSQPGHRATRKFTYEPTNITEKTLRDTTTQVLAPTQEGTSGRVIANVIFKKGKDSLWANEPVFLEVIGTKQVYRATTNQNGEARFLLPKGQKYMIHGRYAQRLDVIDLSRRRGIGYATKGVQYRPLDKYQYPEKHIPKPDQLLLTAFHRFLDKQYPEPAPGTLLSLQGQWLQPFNASSKDAVLNITLTATQSPDLSRSKPLNIAFVVDKSGSMSGDRIENLITSLLAFTDMLRPQDVVSLTAFDDIETVIFSSRPVGPNKTILQNAIKRLEADNGTNIACGLRAGYKELMKQFKPELSSRLILLSDGYGGEPVEETLGAQTPYTAKGAECTAVGVGEDYNYALLKQLATQGGGLIEHVGDPAQLQQVFTAQLRSVLQPCASDLELEVLYDKRLAYNQFYGFPLIEQTPGRLRLKMRDMYAGLSQIAYLRFRVAEPVPGIQDQPVTIRAKYRNLSSGQVEKLEQKIPLVWKEASGELELLFDQNERKMYAVAVMNQSLKVMSEKFHAGDLGAAKAALLDGLETLKKVYPGASDEDLNALKADLEKYLDIIANQIK